MSFFICRNIFYNSSCKKLYEHQFDEAYLAEKVKDYYASNPAVYTQAGHDRWEPHYMYIGEVVEAIEQ